MSSARRAVWIQARVDVMGVRAGRTGYGGLRTTFKTDSPDKVWKRCADLIGVNTSLACGQRGSRRREAFSGRPSNLLATRTSRLVAGGLLPIVSLRYRLHFLVSAEQYSTSGLPVWCWRRSRACDRPQPVAASSEFAMIGSARGMTRSLPLSRIPLLSGSVTFFDNCAAYPVRSAFRIATSHIRARPRHPEQIRRRRNKKNSAHGSARS